MEPENKRDYERFDSLNLLSFAVYDENNTLIRQGMGRTLNVSLSGILIETHVAIDTRYQVALAIGFREQLVDVKGQPIHCRKSENDMYETGVSFIGVDETQQSALTEFVKAFEAGNPPQKE